MKLPHYDRILHHGAGTWCALAGAGAALLFGQHPALGAIAWAFAAGLLREIYNERTGGRWSNADLGWTTLGGVPVAAALLLAGLL